MNEFLYLAQMRQDLMLLGPTGFTPRISLPNPIHLRRMRPPLRQTLAVVPASALADTWLRGKFI